MWLFPCFYYVYQNLQLFWKISLKRLSRSRCAFLVKCKKPCKKPLTAKKIKFKIRPRTCSAIVNTFTKGSAMTLIRTDRQVLFEHCFRSLKAENKWKQLNNPEAKKVLDTLVDRKGRTLLSAAHSLSRIGACYYFQGRYVEALDYSTQAFAIRKKLFRQAASGCRKEPQ